MPQQEHNYDDEASLGMIMLMSGDEALGKAGKALISRSNRRRGRFSALKDGFILDNTTGEVFEDPQVAQHLDETRSYKRAKPDWKPQQVEGGIDMIDVNPNSESFGQRKQTESGVPPLSNTDRQKASEFDHLAGQLDSVADATLQNESKTASPVLDSILEPLKSFDMLQPAANALEQAVYDEDASIIRQTGHRLEAELSIAMAGLNVTGYEMSARQKWSPFAAGLDDKQKIKRARNLAKIFREKGASIRGANSPSTPAAANHSPAGNIVNFEDLP